MKYITQKWPQNKDGYLFCLQRIQEMLFHYSDDIFKAPVHNTITLLDEYLQTYKIVNESGEGESQLKIIEQEICDSLNKDPIILKMHGKEFINEILNLLFKDTNATINYLVNKIPDYEYYYACLSYLKENIKKANHKREIEKGIRIWVAFVVWYGYTPEYIYGFLKGLFDTRVNNPKEVMDQFWERFNFKTYNFKVYFVFSGKLENYKDLLYKRLDMIFDDDGNFQRIKIRKKNVNGFIGYLEINALDDYSAMTRAYGLINIFLRFYKIFTNKKEVVVEKCGMVINEETKESRLVQVVSSGYKNWGADPHENFSNMIDNVVLGCQSKSKNAYVELMKVVDLHNSALEQESLDDAFLNLWSALEVIGCSSESKNKMEGIINNITPILQNDYFPSFFENLYYDLKDNLPKSSFHNLLKDITEFEADTQKIAGFVLLEKYNQLREQYFENELKLYPNIRNKIYKFTQDINTYLIWKVTEDYRQRVQWHLYRLYRLRNSIVHMGESHRRIQALGEHLHIYVDRVIDEVITKLTADENLMTISDVFVDTQLLANQKVAWLKSERRDVDKHTIELLFEHFFIVPSYFQEE